MYVGCLGGGRQPWQQALSLQDAHLDTMGQAASSSVGVFTGHPATQPQGPATAPPGPWGPTAASVSGWWGWGHGASLSSPPPATPGARQTETARLPSSPNPPCGTTMSLPTSSDPCPMRGAQPSPAGWSQWTRDIFLGLGCRQSQQTVQNDVWLGPPSPAACAPAACPQGHFGPNCTHVCQCGPGATCDPVAGSCVCPPGRVGIHCEHGECATGPAHQGSPASLRESWWGWWAHPVPCPRGAAGLPARSPALRPQAELPGVL